MTDRKYDPYVIVHKIQRHALGASLTALGAVDVASDESLAGACAAVREIEGVITRHSEHEHRFVHPLFEPYAPDVVAELDRQHTEFDERFATLERRLTQLEHAAPAERRPLLAESYCDLTHVIAGYYEHPLVEERRAAPVMPECNDGPTIERAEVEIIRDETWPRVRPAIGSLATIAPHERVRFCELTLKAFPNVTPQAICDDAAAALNADALARLRDALFAMADAGQLRGAAAGANDARSNA